MSANLPHLTEKSFASVIVNNQNRLNAPTIPLIKG